MEVSRPGPGEELNLGASPVTPRQAATVIVLRGGSDALEVLLVQRNPEQRFMGGAWVFPGGAVDAHEEGDLAHRLAGVREVEEEAGVALGGPDALHPFSRWITPPEVAKRFDTHFFLARAPEEAQPVVDGSECVDWGWWAPRAALEAYEAGTLMLVFPTIKTLEALQRFATADDLLEWADGREVVPIEPRVVVDGEVASVVLPGEPGYED
jgi:8-oxo-dGTP pyrophosphatase MutT (NUDIX family)